MRRARTVLRGSLTGTVVGALPGAGADIAAWIAYAIAKRTSKTPERFGKGHVEGLAEAGAANNGSLAGTWVPTLVFGIPGDSITAIVLGVLILKGLEPGPIIFLRQPELVYAVFMTFFLANLVMLPLGWLLIRCARQILRVPRAILPPLVLVACIIGSYAINNALFDVGVMLVFGLIGWLFEGERHPRRPGHPRHRPRGHGRVQLHHHDDQGRRRPHRLLRPPGGGGLGRLDGMLVGLDGVVGGAARAAGGTEGCMMTRSRSSTPTTTSGTPGSIPTPG